MLVSGVNKNKDSTFGWNHSTHRLVTKKLVQRANMLLQEPMKLDYEILKYSCVEPDFSRQNITKYIHGHFADIDNPSSNPPDALQLAKRYSEKAIDAHKNGLYKKRDDYLGYALHFIQDMLNPVHVVFVPVPKGHPERVLHKRFETLAATIQEDTFNTTRLPEIDYNNQFFEKVLPEAMRKAKNQLIKLKEGNLENEKMQNIAAQALQNTYKTTYLYLQNFAVQLRKNPNKSKVIQMDLFDDVLQELG